MPGATAHHSNKQKSTRVPAKQEKSERRSLISKWHKAKTSLSLKQWLRSAGDDTLKLQAMAWFSNKRANTSLPQLCIGRTRMRVKKGSGGEHRSLSGK